MPYAIDNQLYLDIRFNGIAFPFDASSDLIFLHLTEGSEQVIPFLSLSLRDNSRWLAQNKRLTVGTKISVYYFLGSAQDAVANRYEFTLVTHTVKEQMGAVDYRIDAVLFAPVYMSGVMLQGIKGSSSYALKTVAESVDFSFSGVGTSDTMVWHASGMPVYKFSRYVADHGFTTESGCMALAITADRRMLYRDITAMSDPVATLSLQNFTQKDVQPITSFHPQETSGGANIVSGNGLGGVEHTVDGESLHTKHKAVSTQVNEQGSLTIDKAAKAKITNGKSIHYPVATTDAAHPDFHRAQYQNARVSLLFNSRVDVVLPNRTDVVPLDTVNLDVSLAVDSSGAGVTRHSGTYRVMNKVTYIVPGAFRVKLSLIRRTSDAGQENPAAKENIKTSAPSAEQQLAQIKKDWEDNLKQYQSSMIVNPGLLRDKVPRLPALSDFLPANLSANAAYIAAAATAAAGAMVTVSALARAITQSTQTAAETGSEFQTLLDALVAQMTSLTTTAQTEITAIRTPAGRTVVTIPLMEARYLTYTTAMEAAIAAATPAIRSEAKKAIELAAIGTDAAASLGTNSGMAASQAAASQLGSAMGAASGSATSASDNATALASMSSTNAAQTAQTAAQTASTTSAMSTLSTNASNWQQVIDDAKATRFTATRATVDAP